MNRPARTAGLALSRGALARAGNTSPRRVIATAVVRRASWVRTQSEPRGSDLACTPKSAVPLLEALAALSHSLDRGPLSLLPAHQGPLKQRDAARIGSVLKREGGGLREQWREQALAAAIPARSCLIAAMLRRAYTSDRCSARTPPSAPFPAAARPHGEKGETHALRS